MSKVAGAVLKNTTFGPDAPSYASVLVRPEERMSVLFPAYSTAVAPSPDLFHP